MKPIKFFLSLIVFAVSLAFNITARDVPPKIITIPVKAEKIVRQVPTKAMPANFVRTDCLVMYESAGENPPAAARYQFQIVESFSVKSFPVSKFFRFDIHQSIIC